MTLYLQLNPLLKSTKALPQHLRPSILSSPTIQRRIRRIRRTYATTTEARSNAPPPNPQPSHKKVTTFNDTGQIRWQNLSAREKAARSTQQSFNFLVVVAGLALTTGVCYVLYAEVFSPSSKTAVFNRSVSRIKGHEECVRVLSGDDDDGGEASSLWPMFSSRIKAYGEPSWSRWSRNRSVSAKLVKDAVGMEHMYMHFYVEGSRAKGVVQVHMVKKPQGAWEYKLLALDVEGHRRIFVEGGEAWMGDSKRGGKMFGVKWW